MTEQANIQAKLNALQERVWEVGRHVVSAHNLVIDVFHESVEVDVPEEFLNALDEFLIGLNALQKIQNSRFIFEGKSE